MVSYIRMSSGILMTLIASVDAPVIHFLTLSILNSDFYKPSCRKLWLFLLLLDGLSPLSSRQKTVGLAVLRTSQRSDKAAMPGGECGSSSPLSSRGNSEHLLVSWPFIPK